MRKTRNDPIQPEIIEEKNVWLINNGALINKPFNSHVFYHVKEKYIISPKKKFQKSLNTKKDHLIDAHIKTPDHPSSIIEI